MSHNVWDDDEPRKLETTWGDEHPVLLIGVVFAPVIVIISLIIFLAR